MNDLPRRGSSHPFSDEQRPFTLRMWKSVFRLQETIRNACLRFGEHRILFCTLTFPYLVNSPVRAQKSFNSLRNWITKNTTGYVNVLGVKRGAIHYHLICVVEFDTQTGTDVQLLHIMKDEGINSKLNCCNPRLAEFWDEFDIAARKRDFGICDLSPIRTNADAISYYCSNNIVNGWDWWIGPEFKRARAWSCSKSLVCTTSQFCFKNSRWREAVYDYVAACGFPTLDAALEVYGKHFDRSVFAWIQGKQYERKHKDRIQQPFDADPSSRACSLNEAGQMANGNQSVCVILETGKMEGWGGLPDPTFPECLKIGSHGQDEIGKGELTRPERNPKGEAKSISHPPADFVQARSAGDHDCDLHGLILLAAVAPHNN